MNFVVDASVWAGGLLPADAHFAASRHWLAERASAGDLLIGPILVLAEVAGAIACRTSDAALADRTVQQMERMPSIRIMPVDNRLGQLAAQLAAACRLRGADAVYVALAHQLGIPLITWDDEQRTRATTFITVNTP